MYARTNRKVRITVIPVTIFEYPAFDCRVAVQGIWINGKSGWKMPGWINQEQCCALVPIAQDPD